MIRLVDRKLTGSRVELDDIARRLDGERVAISAGRVFVLARIEAGQPTGDALTLSELDILEGSEVTVEFACFHCERPVSKCECVF